MTRLALFFFVATGTFHFGLSSLESSSLLAVFAPLAAAITLALVASAHLDAIAVAAGAIGGLLSVALLPLSPALAGAALLSCAFLERTLRVDGVLRKIAHLALAFTGGAAAAALFSHYHGASTMHRGASMVIGGVFLALPMLLRAEDPVAHLLALASGSVGEDTAPLLKDAAELRRWALRPQCAVRGSRALEARWRKLVELVRQRLAFAAVPPPRRPASADATYRDLQEKEGPERRQLRLLDEQIADTCGALRQIYGVEG